jgi:hypothetical protein
MFFSLPNIITPMYSQQLKELFPPTSQNVVAVSNQITLLIRYNICPRLLNLLKIVNAHTQVSDIFDLTVSLKFINFSFQMFLPFLPEMSTSFKSDIILVWIL